MLAKTNVEAQGADACTVEPGAKPGVSDISRIEISIKMVGI